MSLSSTTEGSTIRYTLDGSDPDLDSAIYTEPFAVTESCTVKATITMGADGKPVVAHDPPLTEEEAAKRTYRTLGKKTLDPAEDWTDVTDESDLDAAGWRFFKVKVEMK